MVLGKNPPRNPPLLPLDPMPNPYSNLTLIEAVAQSCSVKKVFLDILQNSQENTCTRVTFNKFAGPGLQLY